jgi:hypothetical protein
MNYRHLFTILVFILCGCEKKPHSDIEVAIEKIGSTNEVYKYDNIEINYQVAGESEALYGVSICLIKQSDETHFNTEFIDTVSLDVKRNDTINLRRVKWYFNGDEIKFDSLEQDYYDIIFTIKNLQDFSTIYESNILTYELNKKNPDVNVLDNFSFTNINGINIDLADILYDKDYVLLFGFAIWCHWSAEIVPQIQSIDSLFSDKIQIIGVEGSNTYNEESVESFISIFNINYPIVIRVYNPVFNKIIYPNDTLSFPSLVLINSLRKVEYRQKGYIENTMDSIMKYTN